MNRLRSVLCLVLVMLLAGCAAAGDSGLNAEASVFTGTPAKSTQATFVGGTVGPYLLAPGDTVRIKAYDDDALSGDYTVGSDGHVSIPLVGDVEAAGLTTRQLEHKIVARMKGKIARDPEINVEIAAYAPFYIHGEVKKASEYPFRPGLIVADAVATACGLTYRANEDCIYVRRAGARTERAVSLDKPTSIFPGDNIRVSERMF